jgi:hypothetical protein
MATALQVLQGAFGVKTITPTDPGIIKLAAIRSGYYPEIGQTVTITPESETLQLQGLIPDPLANLPDTGLGLPGVISKALAPLFPVITGALGIPSSLIPDVTPKPSPVLTKALVHQNLARVFNLMKQRGDRDGIIRLVTQLRHNQLFIRLWTQ